MNKYTNQKGDLRAYEAGRKYAITGDERYAHYEFFTNKGKTESWEAGNAKGKIEKAELDLLQDKFYYSAASRYGIMQCSHCKKLYSVDTQHSCTIKF